MAAKKEHYFVFNTSGPDRATMGLWRIEGPGLKPPLHFTDRTVAQVVRRALEQAFESGRGRTKDTLEPIGERVDDEDTDAEIGKLGTIPDVKR